MSTTAVDTRPVRNTSMFERYGLTTLDVLMLFAVVLLTCVYVPVFYTWFWAPRMMIMYAVALPGLVALVSLARASGTAARLALAAITWSLVTAIASDSFAGAFSGFAGQEMTVVSLTGAFGMWGLAQHMSDDGRRFVIPVLLATLGLNALVGAAQMLLQIDDSNLGLVGGRAVGLTSNSAIFGAMIAMAPVLCVLVADTSRAPGWRWAAAAFGFSIVVSFSGTRVAVAAVVVVAVFAAVRARSPRASLTTVAAFAGLGAGAVIARVYGTSHLDQLSSTDGRLTWWADGVAAIQERPILGWGLGRFRTATQGRFTFDEVAAGYATEAHWDAHNIIVSLAVAVGVPGLILLAAFGVVALRNTSGPLVIAAAAIALSWSLQPLSLTTLPLVMFCVGVATMGARVDDGPDDQTVDETVDDVVDDGGAPDAAASPVTSSATRNATSTVLSAAFIVGIAAAAWLGTAEFKMRSAALGGDAAGADRAAAMYFNDPIMSDIAALQWTIVATVDSTRVPELLERYERTTELEPTRPLWWAELGRIQRIAGDLAAAEASARRGLELQPTHPESWQVLADVAAERGDTETLATANTALCRLGALEECGGGVTDS